MLPNIAAPTTKLPTVATAKVRSPNSSSGRMGSATLRSQATKAASRPRAAVARPRISGDPQG